MNTILNFSLSHGGSVLFLIAFLEQVGVPIPAAPCLLAAGALCVTGEVHVGTALGATILGCLSADLLWFFIGRRGGKRVLHFLARLGLSGGSDIEHTEKKFARQGIVLVIISKFVPGLSLIVPPVAGAFGVGLGRFLLFDTIASLLYAFVYLLLGAVFSKEVEAILALLNHLGLGALLLLLAAIAAWFVFKHNSRPETANRSKQPEKPRMFPQPASI